MAIYSLILCLIYIEFSVYVISDYEQRLLTVQYL
jgi:hypothetical protein